MLGSRHKRCEDRCRVVAKEPGGRVEVYGKCWEAVLYVRERPQLKTKLFASVLPPLAIASCARGPYELFRGLSTSRQRTRHHFDAGRGTSESVASPGRPRVAQLEQAAAGGDAAREMATAAAALKRTAAPKQVMEAARPSRNAWSSRKTRRSASRRRRSAPPRGQRARTSARGTTTTPKKENVVVEYVSAAYDADAAASLFKDVFAKFASAEELTTDQVEEVAAETPAEQKADDVDEDEAPEKRLSRKQRKAMSRMTVAELKQVVARPEAVEAHDVTASDPRLLVFLKSYRNTVPVPRHWCHKRKFLQGKRGVEKNRSSCPSTSPRPVCYQRF